MGRELARSAADLLGSVSPVPLVPAGLVILVLLAVVWIGLLAPAIVRIQDLLR